MLFYNVVKKMVNSFCTQAPFRFQSHKNWNSLYDFYVNIGFKIGCGQIDSVRNGYRKYTQYWIHVLQGPVNKVGHFCRKKSKINESITCVSNI